MSAGRRDICAWSHVGQEELALSERSAAENRSCNAPRAAQWVLSHEDMMEAGSGDGAAPPADPENIANRLENFVSAADAACGRLTGC